MKIDLSSILVVIVAIIPGLFARRARNLVSPESFAAKGASEELAEFVALGITTHGLLILLGAFGAALAGLIIHRSIFWYFSAVDAAHPVAWSYAHRSGAVLLSVLYIFLSFTVSHLLGLAYGTVTEHGGVTAFLLNRASWLEHFGVRGLLGQRPIIYELLSQRPDSTGTLCRIFVEAECKNDLGFYSGQVEQFAIVRDEEPHKPVYLIDPYYKKSREDLYIPLQADGILLDLADVAILLVKRIDTSQPTLVAAPL